MTTITIKEYKDPKSVFAVSDNFRKVINVLMGQGWKWVCTYRRKNYTEATTILTKEFNIK
jgi:hypothetical protein